MKSITKILFLTLTLLVLHSCKKKAIVLEYPQEPAYVTFNLGDNTFKNYKSQKILLFGCNTALTNKSPNWFGPQEFEWKTSDQVLSKVPYGKKTDTTKVDTITYHVNKYYVASPPVHPKKGSGKKTTDIGLVIPDQFTFDGKNPVQEIYLDYTPLIPQNIYLIPLNLDPSIQKRGVTHVPFKVECSDLPWNKTTRIKNGEGASGIGACIPGGTSFNAPNFFLPYSKEGGSESYRDTEVTLLNDIMLRYEYKFRVPQISNDSITSYKEVTTIDVREYFKSIEDKYYDKSTHSVTDSIAMVTIVATKRAKGDIPCGCQPPIVKDGPYGE
jgi:hypothetical protein